ncbi:MAG: alanine dehydrogenase [Bacillota bacterium]|nr:alanine dehydrogenase [Bacillota bacterium]
MIIGIPKEIKNNEFRVAATPNAVQEIIENKNKVYVEKNAGLKSGYTDYEYMKVGAEIVDREILFNKSQLIYKVKEILPDEYGYMRENLMIFTYLHSNSDIKMTKILLENKVIAISYEDIEDKNGNFPLLEPMSEIAGKGGFLAALDLCKSINGGQGLLLSGISGIKKPVVTIIGAGNSGIGAAEVASSLGNDVRILDIDKNKLNKAKNILPKNISTLYSNKKNLKTCIKESDVLINCVLWNKNANGHLIFREDLKNMKETAIIVDVSCDEAGAIETSRPTSHDDPIYFEEGICHYAVDNIPSAYSRTATEILSNSTLPYLLKITKYGLKNTLLEDSYFRKGLSFYKGKLTLKETAVKHNLEYMETFKALKEVE